jgi:DNA repair protein RAD50
MLDDLINRRRENKNFQLIVITHDEDFVNMLNRGRAEYFYKLCRNGRGDSVIERHSVY